MGKQDVKTTSWEELKVMSKALSRIVEETKDGEVLNEEQKELIQKQMILIIVCIGRFSDSLALGEIHE